jgi:hypothetical protein
MLIDNKEYIETDIQLSWINLISDLFFTIKIFIENVDLIEIEFQTKTIFDSKNLIEVSYIFYFPNNIIDKQKFVVTIKENSCSYNFSDFPNINDYKPLLINQYKLLFNEAEDNILKEHLTINTNTASLRYFNYFDEPKVLFGTQYSVGCETGKVIIL